MREAINAALKEAMKAGDKERLSTLRLMNAAIKDRDIEARGAGKEPLNEEELLQLFQKMVKQRQESAKVYEENNRPELAAQERNEIGVIQNFMPAQMDEAAMAAAVDAIVTEIGAAGLKDMGRVMAALKERHTGTMDFGKANGLVKQRLG
ncbi:GatB/YqeY domain-containing protein [Terrihabitans sp. B22-R8]|uniref:GatB/YqeY domain-containing protein n=1 Tax=Terrihabitans sp. B22-R8 TaxID=3425128 RepID=UPI00403C5316